MKLIFSLASIWLFGNYLHGTSPENACSNSSNFKVVQDFVTQELKKGKLSNEVIKKLYIGYSSSGFSGGIDNKYGNVSMFVNISPQDLVRADEQEKNQWRGIIQHEAGHLYYKDSNWFYENEGNENIFIYGNCLFSFFTFLAFDFFTYDWFFDHILRAVPFISDSAWRPFRCLYGLTVLFAASKIAVIHPQYREYRADTYAIDVIKDPAVLKGVATFLQKKYEKELEKIPKIGKLQHILYNIAHLTGPNVHPHLLSRAQRFYAAAEKLEKQMKKEKEVKEKEGKVRSYNQFAQKLWDIKGGRLKESCA
jgi:hypothetical protein